MSAEELNRAVYLLGLAVLSSVRASEQQPVDFKEILNETLEP
ncbi:MAG TPA: hypothetical protein VGM98_01445 [Schlesneria sp.]